MSRHLISATLTDDAYDCYSHWVKERRGSEMISRVIVESFADVTAAEQIVKWRKGRLVDLVRVLLSKIPENRYLSISEEDRASIEQLAKPDRTFSSIRLGVEEE
jgi:predicted RNA-binding protein with EMAP domain